MGGWVDGWMDVWMVRAAETWTRGGTGMDRWIDG